MNGLDVEPSACTWCGIAQRGHARQYADAVGWHAWAQPSQEQILARMKARRLQLAVAKAGPSPLFPTVAALRELSSREEPHDSPLHQEHRIPHDLPLGCGLTDAQVEQLGNPFLDGGA